MALVTLLTDFGAGKYVASMKGVILSIHPKATVVDIDHEIAPQNVREGAFVLAAAVPHFPPAVHVAVVDPGVGTKRRPLVVECERGLLVGPDNGLLLPAARRLGFRQAYEATRSEYWLPEVSDTFHGRDVFAPLGAHLSRGRKPREVGASIDDPVDLDFGSYRVTEGEVHAEVLYQDRFGNLTTNVPREALPGWIRPGATLVLRLRKEYRVPFHRSYGHRERGRPLLTLSSDGFLEIAVNRGNAAEMLGARPGDPVTLHPDEPGRAM